MIATLTDKEIRWRYALDQVISVCVRRNIAYFLDTGTLLGAVRDGKFIPWDNDIDIGLPDMNDQQSAALELARDCANLGFIVNMSSTSIGMLSRDGVEINFKYYQRNGKSFTADYSYFHCRSTALAFVYSVTSGNRFRGYGNNAKQALKNMVITMLMPFRAVTQKLTHSWVRKVELVSNFDRLLILPLSEVRLYDVAYAAPAKADAYLSARYGPDWSIPKENYDYLTEDQSFAGSCKI